MNLKIRPFKPTKNEYEAIARIQKSVTPEHSRTADELEHIDQSMDADTVFSRFIGELDGQIVAFSTLGQPPVMKGTDKFWLNFYLYPDFEQKPYVEQLHSHLIEGVTALGGTEVATNTTEAKSARIAFLEKHGYQCMLRECTSKLDLAQFDPAPFLFAVEQSKQANIALYSLVELKEKDPNWLAKVEALSWSIGGDIPSVDPQNPASRQPLEEYVKRFELPGHMSEGWFVAVDETDGPLAHYVGLSYLWRVLDDPKRLDTGITGVLRSYRRKGIATTLKLHAFEFAKAYGAEIIWTENEENNPMYQINLRMGFKPEPAWLEYVKDLS